MAKATKANGKSLLRRIPYLESMLSLSDQLGITPLLKIVGSIVGGMIIAIAAWVWSESPPWVLVSLMIAGIGLSAWVIDRILAAIIRSKQLRGMETIDRDALAKEMENAARGILALVAEHRGAIEAAFIADINSKRSRMSRSRQIGAEGNLVEKYGQRFASDAWRLIYASEKITDLDKSKLWHMSHGIRNEYDINTMGLLLLQIASDVRHGVKEDNADKGK